MRLIDNSDIENIQGGIHCADDIGQNGWMFAMGGLLGHMRFED